MIEIVEAVKNKKDIAQNILSSLPEWFGIEASLNEYLENVERYPMFVCWDDAVPIGFYSLKPTSNVVLEIYVCGVLPHRHREGMGRLLYKASEQYAQAHGFEYMQVKTVATGHYDIYDLTNAFYTSLGFQAFEVLTNLWDQNNPCQIYIKHLVKA